MTTISFLVSAVAAVMFAPVRLQSQNRGPPQILAKTQKPIDWEEDT